MLAHNPHCSSPTDLERAAVRETVELLAEHPGALTRRFYRRFFERHPSVRELFGTYSQADQARMLHETLVSAVDLLDDAIWLSSTMRALGHRHTAYEVTDEMYEWFTQCFIETLTELLGPELTPEHVSGWSKVLDRLCSLMRRPDV